MYRIVVTIVMGLMLASLLVLAQSSLQFSFLPNVNATFTSFESTHTFDLTFATLKLKWKAGVWSSLEASLPEDETRYVLDLIPTLCVPISVGNWQCQFHITFHYRTSFSNPMDPQLPVIFLDSW